MVAKNTVFRLFARGDCGMYRYIVPFSSLANHSRALFGVVNSKGGSGDFIKILQPDPHFGARQGGYAE